MGLFGVPDSVYEAMNYKNGFRDGKEGRSRSFASRLQDGPQRVAYDKGYEDGLRQRQNEGHTRIKIDSDD